jgi:alcohol dehydrogenase
VALLATNPGSIEEYEGKGKYKSPPLPVLAIPTTCGTASEVTWVSVVTHTERMFKMSIKGPLMFPAVALVDPDLLVTLPSPLIASTGMDALTHAIEAYTVKPATFMTDIFARESLKLIFQSLERAYRDIKNDKEAREKIMKGSMIAGMAFGNSDVGAVHCIAEAVGSLYDTPHGVANSVFLPYVMEFNLPAAKSRYAEIARIAGIQEEENEAAAQKLIQKIKDLSRSLSIPSFRDLGIEKDKFAEIAEKSFQNNSNSSNPREAGVADYMGILEKAYSD